MRLPEPHVLEPHLGALILERRGATHRMRHVITGNFGVDHGHQRFVQLYMACEPTWGPAAVAFVIAEGAGSRLRLSLWKGAVEKVSTTLSVARSST